MKERFRNLIDAVDAATHEVVIRKALADFSKAMGYQRFAFLQGTGLEVKTFNNYPPHWQDLYLDNGFSAVDPVVSHAKRLKKAFLWTADEWNGRATAANVRAFADDAVQHGLRSGLTVPVEGSYGRTLMLTLATDKTDIKLALPDNTSGFANAVLAVHYNLLMVAGNPLTSPRKVLSPREAQCLSWSSKGLRAAEIAELLNVATRSVQDYLDHAREKLDATTLPHAVAIGKEQKLC
jgi:LuxR family transcriptional activator of conjugal transfer of Ti plasmids